MPPPPSAAWEYFKRAGWKKVKCQICSVELTYTGGTTDMLSHLKPQHSTEAVSPEKKPSVVYIFDSRCSYK